MIEKIEYPAWYLSRRKYYDFFAGVPFVGPQAIIARQVAKALSHRDPVHTSEAWQQDLDLHEDDYRIFLNVVSRFVSWDVSKIGPHDNAALAMGLICGSHLDPEDVICDLVAATCGDSMKPSDAMISGLLDDAEKSSVGEFLARLKNVRTEGTRGAPTL